MKRSKTEVFVSKIPKCDFCSTLAFADARLLIGGWAGWANVCKKHFDFHGCKLGLGNGQVYRIYPK